MNKLNRIPIHTWFWIIVMFILPLPIENMVEEEVQQLIWTIHFIPAVILSYYFGVWGGLFTAVTSTFLHLLWKQTDFIVSGKLDIPHNFVSLLASMLLQIIISIGIGMLSSRLKKKQLELQQLMYKDPLTDLWNRRYFQKAIKETLSKGRSKPHLSALLFLDLDRFKNVNDMYGHPIGDQLLKLVAVRVSQSVEELDGIVSRLDGDEFTIIIPCIRDERIAETAANRILHTLAECFTIDGHNIYISASIGIAFSPKDSSEPDDWCSYADMAMYEAKKEKDSYHVFSEALSQNILRKAKIESGLRNAIAKDELQLVYQPKFQLADMKIIGAEALLRWHSTELGDIPPSIFIPIAEETGFIHVIGDWALNRACEQNKKWIDEGYPPVRISVNLSVRQLQSGNVFRIVSEKLATSGLSAEWLELELTETVFMNGNPLILQQIQQLRELGVTISIDDFGSGYSSLAYLKSIPADIIKIDKSFIQSMLSEKENASIVSTIISLGHLLNKRVLAEGIEIMEHVDELHKYGCDEGQGYLLGMPMSEHEFVRCLKRIT